MKAFGLDVKTIALSFCVVLAILTGGRVAAYHVQVERPLVAFLSQRPEVLEHSLTRTPPGVEIRVRLADVPNLQSAYAGLRSGLARAAGSTPWRLVLGDARSGELERVHRRVRLAIEEAVSRGTFREMAACIDELAGAAGLDRWDVYVDSRYVYVQLHKDGRYLYDVVPRPGVSAPQDDGARELDALSGSW